MAETSEIVRGFRTSFVCPRYLRIQSALKGSRSSGATFAEEVKESRTAEGEYERIERKWATSPSVICTACQ